MRRPTLVLMLNDGADGLQQRSQKVVVRLVGQEEGRGRHGVEEEHDLQTRRRAQAFQVCRYVVDNSKEGGIYRCQLSPALGDEGVY